MGQARGQPRIGLSNLLQALGLSTTVGLNAYVVGLVIHPVAGAIVFLAASSDAGAVHPVLAAILLLLLAVVMVLFLRRWRRRTRSGPS